VVILHQGRILPQGFQSFGQWLPHYHLGKLALSVIGQNPEPLRNAASLAAWTVVAIGLALVAFKRDEGKLYG
jgi:ABC-type transport system involved in multi-copper enzyme maturation permease subunit